MDDETGKTGEGDWHKLMELRQRLDKIDSQIVRLLEVRAGLVRSVAEHKKERSISIIQKEREEEIMKKLEGYSMDTGLDKEFLQDIFMRIIEESKKEQKRIVKE